MTIVLTDSGNQGKVIIDDPQQKSKGYRHSVFLRSGMQLLIQEYQLQDHLVLFNSDLPLKDNVEFVFNLIGQRSNQWENSGQSCICFCPNFHTEPQQYIQEWSSQQWIKKVDIHIECSLLQKYFQGQLDQLPFSLNQALKYNNFDVEPYVSVITPTMQLVLEQILNCPYQGMTEKLYLESRVLELIALQIDHYLESKEPLSKSVVIKFEDMERLHYAKEILVQRMDYPPSLLELAQLVGLNEYKLKLGFREVFGITPFAYLRDRRLEKAQRLIQEGDMSIEVIANSVGYANRSRFARAFRKKYGLNPREYKSHNSF